MDPCLLCSVSEQQGKPGPHSERLRPPSADYWGWPLFGHTPLWSGDGRLASLGVQMPWPWICSPLPTSGKDQPPVREAETLSQQTT